MRKLSVTVWAKNGFSSPSSVSWVTASTTGTAGGRVHQKKRTTAIATANTAVGIHIRRWVEPPSAWTGLGDTLLVNKEVSEAGATSDVGCEFCSAPFAPISVTGARKRYPRLASVSM